ncbi:MAG: metallophosphoesterase family protein, partial [Eubacterium sp.]
YWSKDLFTAINHRKAFRQIIGHSPWTHYVVNGYHFIGASPNTGSMQKGYKYTAKWLDNHLKKAEKDSEDKPIFVVTHNQPLDTCYGSDEWGDVTLGAVLSKYPNVINLSGHTHYSILDERSVWQGDYTVISTQSLSYTELETGKENGTIPPNADATPMGYIIEFSDDRFAFRRINFAVSEFCKEEKADAPWVFPLPYKNDGRYSYEKRKPLNKPPVITNTDATAHIDGKNVILSFNAAQDDDFVHSYKVIIDDRETKYFFSDFYNGIDNMKKTVEIKLKKPTGKAKHTYKIFAVDSWGEESKNFINIETE